MTQVEKFPKSSKQVYFSVSKACALGWSVFVWENSIEKKAKKVDIFQYFGDFFKSSSKVQKLNVCACLTRLIKSDKKKITLNILQ
jgi:hypothetical protein